MQNQFEASTATGQTFQNACLLGMWTSLLISISAIAAFGIAITTAPARSGPNCPPLVAMGVLDSCIEYPYTDVAAFVPMEYLWMFPALLLSLLFVVLIASIYHCSLIHQNISARISIYFSIISASIHSINYFIQLSVVQPSLLKAENESLVLLSQYNPHGVFIALENLGYFMMGLSFMFISFSFNRLSKLSKSIRYLFLLSSILVVVGLLVLGLWYKSNLEYRYEVLSLTIDWLVLIVAGILLFFYFRRMKSSVKP